jgi:hypothetical protein
MQHMMAGCIKEEAGVVVIGERSVKPKITVIKGNTLSICI